MTTSLSIIVLLASTYADLKPVLDASCHRCHNPRGAAGFLPLTSLEEIKPNREAMISALADGYMPLNNPTFKDTPDGLRLQDWLKTGTDLVPAQPCPDPGPPHLLLRDPRELRYEDLKPIVDRKCTGCHGPNGSMARKPLTSLVAIRRHARDAWEQLDGGTMPQNDAAFAYTPDGRALAAWLRFGTDVTWRGPGGGDDDDRIIVGDDD